MITEITGHADPKDMLAVVDMLATLILAHPQQRLSISHIYSLCRAADMTGR